MKALVERILVDPADVPWVLLYVTVIALVILAWAWVPA